MNKKVIWVGIASALLIGGGIFWWMRNKKKAQEQTNKNKSEELTKKESDKINTDENKESEEIEKKSDMPKGEQNFKDLLKNLGRETSGDSYTTEFNEGKNVATFFNNNRFAIKVKDSGLVSKKGTYINGGKKLILDSGNVVESNSVWGNLLTSLKK